MWKRNNGWRRGALFVTSLGLLLPVRGFAVQTTTVQGVVYRADGSVAQGTVLVSWPAFTAADGSAITAGSMTTAIAADGSVSLSLAPNAGANPQGTYYTAVFHMTDGSVETEYWVVPQAATATISEMRARVVPAAVAQQSVTQQYVDSSIGALQGSYLQLRGGTMGGPLNLSADPTSALEAATKEYVDAHAGSANLPTDSIPYQGTSGTQPVAATPANIASLYSSTSWGQGTATVISTSFTEGAAGSTIVGTKPATDIPNSAWSGGSNFKFVSGGATAGNNNGWSVIDTGVSNGTYTFQVSSLSGSVAFAFNSNAAINSLLQLVRSGTTWSLNDYEGSSNPLTSATVAATSGTITVTISGTSISANVFGTVMNASISSGSPVLSQTRVGFWTGNTTGNTITLSSLSVTGTGTVASPVACAGFLNADGSCSAPAANNIAAGDDSGHFISLPEKGITNKQGVGSIAWQDDFKAGLYDPRDPRWGAQDTPAHQAAALQTMSNQMACDLAMGKVQQAVAKFPQGLFYADQLQIAPGSSWEGTANAKGGTMLRSFVNNHYVADAVPSMTLTCSDGQSHTDSAPQTHFSHFTLIGCSTGGCSNAAGDTGYNVDGGPANVGFYMSSTAGIVEWIDADNFGGPGIIVNAMDAKAFHLNAYGGLDWYYYGTYKGLKETAASPEASAVTTGTTGSVALSWTAVPGATGYVVYRGSTAGGESAWFKTTTNSFTDTGAAGAPGIVSNVVTSGLTTPGAITATPSTSGGTLAAGTYYYKITAYTADGWHGIIELTGTDNMADWVEVYGLFDAPNVYTYLHLADILGGGGDSHFDHLWPQLGLIGIAQPYGFGANNTYENVRIDFARTYGFWTDDLNVNVIGGVIDGSCTASNALTINTGQYNPFIAGTCEQFFKFQSGGTAADLVLADNNGFGPTVKTADFLDTGGYHKNVSGTIEYIPGLGTLGGGSFDPQGMGMTNVSGPNPVLTNRLVLNPTDTSPITYTGFLRGQGGQDFYVAGGNANVTIANNANIMTCSGSSINLGSVTGFLHFRQTGVGLYSQPSAVKEVCSSKAPQTTLASSETVAFSATPVFSIATRTSMLTLTGNVSSFTLAAGTDGQEKTLIFCNDATGGYTVTAPANVRGFMTVGTTAGKCSAQHFTYSAAQSAWLADSPGVMNQ